MKTVSTTTPVIYNNRRFEGVLTFPLDNDGNVVIQNDFEKVRISKDIFVQAVKKGIFEFTISESKESKMNELKPCPFCGAENTDIGFIRHTDNCYLMRKYMGVSTKQQLIDAWNDRPIEFALAEENKILREIIEDFFD